MNNETKTPAPETDHYLTYDQRSKTIETYRHQLKRLYYTDINRYAEQLCKQAKWGKDVAYDLVYDAVNENHFFPGQHESERRCLILMASDNMYKGDNEDDMPQPGEKHNGLEDVLSRYVHTAIKHDMRESIDRWINWKNDQEPEAVDSIDELSKR